MENYDNKMHQAEEVARKFHSGNHYLSSDGQRRDQIDHIQEVVNLMISVNATSDEICAAWLHDILEYTDISHKKIIELFEKDIYDIILELTDIKRSVKSSLSDRKKAQIETSLHFSSSAKKIKIADQLSNIRSLQTCIPASRSHKDLLVYITSAKSIVKNCADASSQLADMFDLEYIKTRNLINKTPSV